MDTLTKLVAAFATFTAMAALLANTLPKSWRLTMLLARFVSDARGLHVPAGTLPPQLAATLMSLGSAEKAALGADRAAAIQKAIDDHVAATRAG